MSNDQSDAPQPPRKRQKTPSSAAAVASEAVDPLARIGSDMTQEAQSRQRMYGLIE